MFCTNSAVEGHPQGRVDHLLTELFHPLAVKGELVIIEIDVTDTKLLVEVGEMTVEVLSRIIAKTAAKYGAVAVAAGIGTAPA